MVWDCDRPIKELPENLRHYYVEEANFLFNDLTDNPLTILLVPAPDPAHSGHMIRYVENENPSWYRGLYHSHNSFRRDLSLRALNRIKKEEDRPFKISPFKYDSIYRELIHERLTEPYLIEGHYSIPEKEILKHFTNLNPDSEDNIPF